MRLPTIQGLIKRRILVNFRADPTVIQSILPAPFWPKLHEGQAVVGVCLIRLENTRPIGVPSILGHSSENAAHRIAIQWIDSAGKEREGVFIPRRDTGSILNVVAGGRVFPGEHHRADFAVADDGNRINFEMTSSDEAVRVRFAGEHAERLPSGSIFKSAAEASSFFEGGSVGFSVTRDVGTLDGLKLETLQWRVNPLGVEEVSSSWFGDKTRFPKGSVVFDHALIMRDIAHQ